MAAFILVSAAAANSLIPQVLVSRHSTISVTGWGLFISGLI
ncbi:Protein of unknown function [Lactobacillus equicursoris 66c]|uniref:Uncharacterized protein n=1 Tax=Lactobacillus equicursoris 66c TaxID=872326 RepID=K0NR31_9LACO|nr:Protein of unknown function [Lactobacillus equicursoris 66c]